MSKKTKVEFPAVQLLAGDWGAVLHALNDEGQALYLRWRENQDDKELEQECDKVDKIYNLMVEQLLEQGIE